MSISVEQEGGQCRLAIDGEMNIYTAAEMKPGLLEPFTGADEVEVNLENVSEIDSAGVQLLILAKREAAATNKSLRLVGHSQVVVDALELCNLSGFFGDPLVIQSRPEGVQP